MKKPSAKAISCVFAMSQPTRGEFVAAWNHGLIDVTVKGEEAMRRELKSIVVPTRSAVKAVRESA